MTIKSVLFLCTGNYYRSRLAEELFNFRAQHAGLIWRALSRGLAPELGSDNVGPMSEFALDALKSQNIVPAGAARNPATCTVADLESADLVVALNEAEHRELLFARFSGWESRVSYWHVDDIDAAPPKVAIKRIDKLVGRLVADLRQPN